MHCAIQVTIIQSTLHLQTRRPVANNKRMMENRAEKLAEIEPLNPAHYNHHAEIFWNGTTGMDDNY